MDGHRSEQSAMNETGAATSSQRGGFIHDNAYHYLEQGVGTPPPLPVPSNALLRSMVRYRWVEVIGLLVALGVMLGIAAGVRHHQYVPQVVSHTTTGETIVGNNTYYSFPVRLHGRSCTPDTLDLCARKESDDPCCASMLDSIITPEEAVSTRTLYVIIALVPTSILLLRHLLYTWFAPKAEQSLRDVLLGFAFALVMTVGWTDMLKEFVAMPRPNHYALRIFASATAAPSGRTYEGTSWRSFPSGHASSSMTSMLYVTLVLLDDIRKVSSSGLVAFRTIFVIVAFAPVYLALWIAATRVWDYWHTPADVTCGALLGAAWAVVAHYHIIPANCIPARPNERLKFF